MKNLVYRIVFENRKEQNILPYQYIGSKSNCIFENNKIKTSRGKFYYGSSTYENWDQIVEEEKDHVTIEVLKWCDEYVEALNYESTIQKSLDVVANPSYFNLSIATVNNFTDPNYATYKHTIYNKTVRLPRNHPAVISGEYVGVSSGVKFTDKEKRKRAKFGKDNHFYGKEHTDSTKKHISEKRKEQGDLRKPESIQNFIENVAKKPKSQEHRKKIGRKNLIMLKNVNTFETIRISRESAHLYDSNIWQNPYKVLHSGKPNGKKWCTNGVDNILLAKGENPPEGFEFGRTMKKKEVINED